MEKLLALWLATSIVTLILLFIGGISIDITVANDKLKKWRIPIVAGFVLFAPVTLPSAYVLGFYQLLKRR